MKRPSRADRVGVLIQEVLAELLLREIHDPRLRRTTVTRVRMTRDLRLARVYFTGAAGGSEAAAEAVRGFQCAAGFIKRRLGPVLGLRYMPDFEFRIDETYDAEARIDRLLHARDPMGHEEDPAKD